MKERDLVFVGGGHTHALAIRSLAMRAIAGVRITLISEQTLTPYSGMLPGFVAGHYTLEETHIDLNRLCQWAGIRWVKGTVVGIDPQSKRVRVAGSAAALSDRTNDSNPDTVAGDFSVSYDTLSIDIGSTPDLSVPGAGQFAVGVKPVSHFNQAWSSLLSASHDQGNAEWGVIGAGAGGVELVLAMAHRLNRKGEVSKTNTSDSDLKFHLVFSSERVLPGYPLKLVEKVEQRLKHFGIQTHNNFRVTQVTSEGLESELGEKLALDKSIWCTGASAAQWPASSGITVSERGFIAVNSFLQSVSHSDIYAVGDCSDMLDDPRPKAGVYAVRQAPFLVENLRASLGAGKSTTVALQSDFLSLLSLGDKTAVGCRAGWVAEGAWVWKLKDYIDSKFMQRLNQPGTLAMAQAPDAAMAMHCAGCGSKLGPATLAGNLSQLTSFERNNITPALGHAEDASLWQVSAGAIAVQSIDGFRSFTDDLWRFGKICVNHALSDLYAMGATPVSAQVWINLAFAHPRLQKRDHLLLMSGIATALEEHQVTLAGGHSTEGMENHVAVVANGELPADRCWRKNTPRKGDVLVLTKPLGSGVILAADMQARAYAVAVDAAFEMMLQSNRSVAERLFNLHPSAVTDVTGFGLLGHLLEMMTSSTDSPTAASLGAKINIDTIPFLAGAQKLVEEGFQSTIYPQLEPYLLECRIDPAVERKKLDLLLDPQTSGGLLISLDPASAEQLVEQMDSSAAVIGSVIESDVKVVVES